MGQRGRCGTFFPISDRPYEICPMPGDVPPDDTTRECCRHFAFCVPPSRPAFAVEDRIATVVAAPRLFRLPEDRWQAILAHELGHAVDFYLFGPRYRLAKNELLDTVAPELRSTLSEIDQEPDPELRADALGELLVLKPLGQKLCYDPVLTLQTLVDPAAPCNGDGSGRDLMRHYSHAPLQGTLVA